MAVRWDQDSQDRLVAVLWPAGAEGRQDMQPDHGPPGSLRRLAVAAHQDNQTGVAGEDHPGSLPLAVELLRDSQQKAGRA